MVLVLESEEGQSKGGGEMDLTERIRVRVGRWAVFWSLCYIGKRYGMTA